MREAMRRIICVMVVLLVAGVVLAEGVCGKCGKGIESDRWNFCPYCGAKLGQAAANPPTAGVPAARAEYEAVSWAKVKFEKKKYHNRKIKLTVRYTGIKHHFAPAERLGITNTNFINFSFVGNLTNYVDKKKVKVVEKLKRLGPYTMIVIYGVVKVQVDAYGRGNDVYVVLVDDIDVE